MPDSNNASGKNAKRVKMPVVKMPNGKNAIGKNARW